MAASAAFLARLGRGRAERRILDEVDLVSAGEEVGQRFAFGEVRSVALVDRDPLVFGPGNEAFRRKRRLARIVAAAHDAALFRRLDDDLRSVDMAGDDVATGVDQRVRGLGFADRHRPVAGEDHLHRRVGIGRTRAEKDRIDVAEHARDRLGGDESDLVLFGAKAGGDAVDVVRLIEVAEIRAGVLRILVLVPEGRRVAKLDVRIFLRQVDDERRVVAERRRQNEARAVEVDHQLHGFGDGVGFGDVLFLDHLDARHFLQRLDRHGVGLVPAKIVARADVDNSDREVSGGESALDGAEIERCSRDAQCGRLEKSAAREFRT